MIVRHKARHGLILFLEFVSMIPWEILYTTMLREPQAYAYYCIRLRYTLRVCRVHSFFVEFKSYVGSNTHIMHLAVIVTLLSVAAATLGCFSYIYECRIDNMKCEKDSAGHDSIARHVYYGVVKLYLLGIVPPIKGTVFENVFISAISYILAVYFLSFLMNDILQTLHGRFEHLNLFTWLNSNMSTWRDKYKKEWKSYYIKYELLVNQFSDMMWAKTRGCPESQYLGKLSIITLNFKRHLLILFRKSSSCDNVHGTAIRYFMGTAQTQSPISTCGCILPQSHSRFNGAQIFLSRRNYLQKKAIQGIYDLYQIWNNTNSL